MSLQMTRRGLLGLLLSIVFGLPTVRSLAQEPQPLPPKPEETATSQPASSPDSRAALEKLMRLRDQYEREQAQKREAEAAGQPTPEPAEDAQAEPDQPAKSQPSMAELQARARASTQRGAKADGKRRSPADDVPDDFVGPAPRLANVRLPSTVPMGGAGPAAAEPGVPPPTLPEGAEAETAENAPAATPEPPAPAEPPMVRKPRSEDENWFNYEKIPFDQVVKQFAERIGKPIMDIDSVSIGGELTYTSDRKFTKEEAIDELNLILHEKGYRFLEEEHHIYIVPLAEMRQKVPVKSTYNTVDAFEEANPRDMEFVTVYYQVPDQPAQLYVDMFSDALPDYALLSALKDSNQIKIVALARDVRKFLSLKRMIDVTPEDPRIIRIFDIKTNASDIEQRVRSLLNIGGGGVVTRAPVATPTMVRGPDGRMIPSPTPPAPVITPAAGGVESQVQMVADERTNSIIVKATIDKIKEIEGLIETLDKKPDIGKFETKVIPVLHADASEAANLLNQILQQEQGQRNTPNWQLQQQLLNQQRMQQMQQVGARGRRGAPQPVPTPMPVMPGMQMQGASPEDILTEGVFERAKKTIRLVADTRTNSLVVYANDEGFNRVYEILKIIDKALPDSYQLFKLENARVEDISQLVTQVAQSVTSGGRGGRTPTIVPDAASNSFHVIAEGDDMDRIGDLIKRLDVKPAEQARHIVELKKLKPSDVAKTVEPLLASSSGTVASTGASTPVSRGPRGRMPNMPVPVPTPTPSAASATKANNYQIIALDDAQMLIVVCSDEDWAKIEGTIRMWEDHVVTNTPRLETLQVAKGNAASIANTLSGFYQNYTHPTLGSSRVSIQAEGDKLYVFAVQPAIDEIRDLLPTLDVESIADKVEILPLVNADAADVLQKLQPFFASAGGGVALPGRGGAALPASTGKGPIIQADTSTNALIVQADKNDMNRIKDLAMRFDQRAGAEMPEQRFFTMQWAQAQEVAQAVQSIFGAAKNPRGGGSSPIKAMAAGAQVFVEAPRDRMVVIEAFIKQFDDPKGKEMRIETVKLPGMDVGQVVQSLTATVNSLPPRPDKLKATFIPDPTGEAIIVSAPESMWTQVQGWIETYKIGAEDMAFEQQSYVVENADAGDLADLLQKTLAARIQSTKGAAAANRINISVDGRQNRLIVSGPKYVQALAAAQIKELDKAGPEYAPVPITLKNADPNQVVQMIQTMYRSSAGGKGGQDVQVTVSNGQLIVKAPKKKLEEIQALVSVIDAPDPLGVQVKMYDLKVLSASQVQTQVQAFLQTTKKPQKAGGLPPGAFAEPTTNTLVVLAPPELLPMIDSMITELEGKSPPTGRMQAYILKVARADQIAGNVDAMLKAKVAEKEGVKKGNIQTAVFSDSATNRLFVMAPDEYQKMAAELVRLVDEDVATGEIVHIVPLNEGDATQMAQALGQIVQGRGAKGGAASVRIIPDASSNTLLIAGLEKDVAESEKWIKELEGNSTRVPELKTFQLKFAGATDVAEALKGIFGGAKGAQDAVTISTDDYNGRLIVTANRRKMRVVEGYIAELDREPEVEAAAIAGGRHLYFVDIARGSASEIAWDVRDQFPDDKKKNGPTIDSDWYGEYIRVTCRPSEFPRILKVIREFEARAKPERKMVVRSVADPRVLEYLQTQYPEDVDVATVPPSQLRESIVEDVWGPGEEPAVIKEKHAQPVKDSGNGRRVLPFEPGLSLSEVLLDDVEQELFGETPIVPSNANAKPIQPAPQQGRPVQPVSAGAAKTPRASELHTVLTAATAPAQPGPAAPRSSPPPPPPGGSAPPKLPAGGTPPSARPPLPKPPVEVVMPESGEAGEPGEGPERYESPFAKEKVRIVPQSGGRLVIEGPKKGVDDKIDAIDLIEQDLAAGEVVRIFRFKYGDVSAAAEILNIMFNGRPQIVLPQQQPQQGQRGQQQQGGKPGDDSRNQQGGGFMDQLRGMVGGQQQNRRGQQSGSRMEIVPDPGHNYLILKCQEKDLPDIRQLLRELDIPPGEVQVKIIQLKHLLADETAEDIKDVLGISKLQSRRTGSAQPSRTRQVGGAGQQGQAQVQFIEMLQQQMVSVPGVEGGAKIERVEVVPNSLTNSLLISAPPEVMTVIERVVTEMEELEGRDVVGIHYYPLKHAKVDDLLPLLQEIFEAAGSSGGGGGGGGTPRMGRQGPSMRTSSSGSSPASLGPVSVSADPRSNTIIYMAQNKDAPTVEDQIRILDVEGAITEAETYICQYGDAEAIASVAESLFVTSGGGRGRTPGAPGGGTTTSSDIRIVSEAATNTITVWGTPDKRDVIFKKIEELDRLSQRPIREIAIMYADADKLASTLSDIFSNAGSGAGAGAGRTPRRAARPAALGGGGAGGGAALNTGRIMILGDNDAKKLLVRAPDDIYQQIEELVVTLDQPSNRMQLKQYKLRFADAAGVVDSVKSAMTEYLQVAKTSGNDTSFDAFTAVPDTRTNTITVVGSDKTFLFVDKIVSMIDVETPPDQKKDFRIFMLEKADATTVADAINAYATGAAGGRSGGSGAGGGGRRGLSTPTGGAGGAVAGRELNVTAVADATTNSVMVFGRNDDIDTVEVAVIEQLEQSIASQKQIATLTVQNVAPSQIVGFIWQFIESGATQATSGGSRTGRGQGNESAGPQVVPNDNAKTLIVRGTRRQIDEVRDLVARFDDPEIVQQRYKIVQIPYGQDPARLASELEKLVNDTETADAERSGRVAARVTIGVDEYSRVLIPSGDPRLVAQVETIVDQLAEVRSPQPVTLVIDLQNLPASDAEKVVNDLQKKQGGGSTGRSSGASRSGGARSSTPSGGSSTPRTSTPRTSTPRTSTPRSSGGSTPPRSTPPASPRPAGGGGGGGKGPATPADLELGLRNSGTGLHVTLCDYPATAPKTQPTTRSKPASQPQRAKSTDATLMVKPVEWLDTYVAKTPLSPMLGLLLADLQGQPAPAAKPAQEPPRRTPPAPPTTRPAAPTPKPAAKPAAPPADRKPAPPADTQEDESGVPDALQRILERAAKGEIKPAPKAPAKPMTTAPVLAEQPASEPTSAPSLAEGLSGVTGSLRGDVVASAIDDRKIIITGDAGDVEFIQQVLRMMDQTKGPALIDVLPLEKTKATALSTIIDKAIKARLDAAGRKDKFSVSAEARSNSLIVSAPEDIMAEIRILVEKMDREKPGGGNAVKTIELKHIRAAEAAAILQPTIEKYNKMNDVPTESQASVQAIDRNNSVMIIGTPTEIDEFEKWFTALDVEITADQKQKSFVRADAILVQLKNAQAEDVAKVINDMIKAEQDAGQKTSGDAKTAGKAAVKTIQLHMPDGTELPELKLEYPIRMVAEKGTNSLIIFSTTENNEALQAIVGFFDQLPIGADTDVKAFALQHGSSEQIAKLITDTFKDKSYLNRPSEGDGKGLEKGRLPSVPPGLAGKGLPYPLVVQQDPRSNTVILIGRTDAVILAGGLIKELDRPSVDLGLKAYVLPLKNAVASSLSKKLTDVLKERIKALAGDKNEARDSAIIQADERGNRLILFATEEVYDMVEDIVLQLDAADRYSAVDMRYRQLRYADAVKLGKMLEESFKNKKDAEKSLNKDAVDTLSVLADARSNSLLLTGTRDYLLDAERLINDLDKEFDGTVVFQARKPKLNSAANIASLLKDMVDKALTQKDTKLTGTPIHVAADPVSDTILIAAARDDMAILDRWIEILDRPSEIDRMTRIIPLRRGVADDIAKAVTDIFKNKGGGGSSGAKGGEIDVTVTADKSTNSVVAFGPPALLTDIEDFVHKVDENLPTKAASVRIFKLAQADAKDAGDLLERILGLKGGSVGGTGGGGSSSSSSGQTKEDAAAKLLIFQKKHPELGLETLQGLRTDIVVLSDLRTNSLVVTAPVESMPLMESLVEAVDVPPDAARIRVFQLRNADAEQMTKMLDELFKQKTASSSSGSKSGSEGERVLTLAEGLGEGGREEISFTTDVRTNSVIAAGTPGYLNLVEQMVVELDTIPIKDRIVRVYSPGNITAEALVPSIKDWSDSEQKRLQDIGKDVSTGVKQERQITAIANKDANRVILTMDPRFEKEVMRVVSDLDKPPPQVIIQVLIIEVTMDNELDLGIEFAFQDLQYTKAGVNDTTTFDYVGGTDIGAAGSGLGGFTFTITGADFNFLFRTLQNEGNLKVLSRPQIVAMDNKEASIDISDDVPYVSGTQTSTTGQISTSVNRTKVGISLKVTPQINPDGFVKMEVEQKVSDQTGSTVDVGQGVTSPVFFTREAKTNIMVKDAETVVLGGLITSRAENREQKIPLVGDIPGLGLLFRNQTDTSKRTELLLVLTPHVVRTPEDYRRESIIERDRLKLVAPDTLQDQLMQGLRIQPEVDTGENDEIQGTPAEGLPPDSLEPKEEEYGPVRPGLRAPAHEPADPNSYDVPVTLRRPRP